MRAPATTPNSNACARMTSRDIVIDGERCMAARGGAQRCWHLVERRRALEGGSAHIIRMRWCQRSFRQCRECAHCSRDEHHEDDEVCASDQGDGPTHAASDASAPGLRCGRVYIVKKMPGAAAYQRASPSGAGADGNARASELRRIEREVRILRTLAADPERCHAIEYAVCAWRVRTPVAGWCVAFEEAECDLFEHVKRVSSAAHCGLGFAGTRCVVAAVARALDTLHTRFDIVHNDVKPENVLVRRVPDNGQWEYRLTDFGAAAETCEFDGALQSRDADVASAASNDKRALVRTPYYAAPERERNEYGPRSDVWSLGMLAAEVVQGANAYKHLYDYRTQWLPRMRAARDPSAYGECEVTTDVFCSMLRRRCAIAHHCEPSSDEWAWLHALLRATVRLAIADRHTAAQVWRACWNPSA